MDICAIWNRNRLVNPYTGRAIKYRGPTYKRLQIECGDVDCGRWRDTPLINPYTKRAIKQGGPTYLAIHRRCERQPRERQPSKRDVYNLNRFIKGQTNYQRVVSELKSGKKTGHWIWYIFPQIRGLGQSEMSKYYALSSLDEAAAYMHHSLLGVRYNECVKILLELEGVSARHIFAHDDVKVHSSLTLFHLAAPENDAIKAALNKYFGGELDRATIRILFG